MTRAVTRLASAVVLSAGIATPALAQDLIRLIVFPSSSALPVYVAEDVGFFAKQGLKVEVTPTPNSVFMMTGVIDGKFDMANGAIDNYIAFQEGQTPAKTKNKPDLVVFMGGTTLNLPLVVTGDIKTYADLRGKPLGVDAPNTAFAFVLYRMLELKGVKPSDYKVVALGGTKQRWDAMKAGKAAGAMLSDAFSNQAASAGFRVLDNSIDVIGTYQATSYASMRGWATSHRKQVVSFIRAYLAALDWVFDKKNEAQAAKILQKRIKGMSDQAAMKTVAEIGSPTGGAMTRDAKIDPKGLQTVLALRREFGTPKKEIGDPAKYIDMSYYDEAIGKK